MLDGQAVAADGRILSNLAELAVLDVLGLLELVYGGRLLVLARAELVVCVLGVVAGLDGRRAILAEHVVGTARRHALLEQLGHRVLERIGAGRHLAADERQRTLLLGALHDGHLARLVLALLLELLVRHAVRARTRVVPRQVGVKSRAQRVQHATCRVWFRLVHVRRVVVARTEASFLYQNNQQQKQQQQQQQIL